MSGKHVWVVRHESFEEDVAAMWEWLCVPAALRPAKAWQTVASSPRQGDTQLTARGRAALTAHLSADYYARAQLHGLADNPGLAAAQHGQRGPPGGVTVGHPLLEEPPAPSGLPAPTE